MKKKLKNFQLKALEQVVKSGITENFYLAGGTAISIKYNHRFSEDFDFFLFPEKSVDFFHLISNSEIKVTEMKKDTLIFYKDNVRFSFFQYKYPLLKNTIYSDELKINIASDEDIIAMKSIAIMQRGEKKDFFDLYFLMKRNHISLRDIIHLCKKKYEGHFSPSVLLKALTFFKDATQKISEIDEQWEEIKEYFISVVKNYLS